MNNNKEVINGAILIYSCHFHKTKRLIDPNFGLKKKEYNGWKVFYILGNPLQNEFYIIDNNIITIKCEDSYVHLTKKVIMGFKVILELYDIQEGILRCGDDLIFNEQNLLKFLNKNNKNDYIGNIVYDSNRPLNVKMDDNFIPYYFYNHQRDLLNPYNGLLHLTLQDMLNLNTRPNIKYCVGVIFYVSKKICNLLVNYMNSIDWNIFKFYPKYGYPYIIEDVGIGFILNTLGIKPEQSQLYKDIINNQNELLNSDCIGYHTNKYK
jgi:hypothetical protein